LSTLAQGHARDETSKARSGCDTFFFSLSAATMSARKQIGLQLSGLKMPSFNVVLIASGKPLEANTAAFRVPLTMSKLMIRSYMENLYGVKVLRVNTLIQQGKVKRLPTTRFLHKRPDYKKAYITFDEKDFVNVPFYPK
jgi:ribosomal protein L23